VFKIYVDDEESSADFSSLIAMKSSVTGKTESFYHKVMLVKAVERMTNLNQNRVKELLKVSQNRLSILNHHRNLNEIDLFDL